MSTVSTRRALGTAIRGYDCDRQRLLQRLSLETETDYFEWRRSQGLSARWPTSLSEERRDIERRGEERLAGALRREPRRDRLHRLQRYGKAGERIARILENRSAMGESLGLVIRLGALVKWEHNW
jgi:hypothetical protein